jgi:hypothetical protein
MIINIEKIREKRRLKQLETALDLTPEETAMISERCKEMQKELAERAGCEDYPFNIELPDGTIAADRDEVEEWYARNGGRI